MAKPSNGLAPIHPGEILREELEALGLSANALAKSLQVPTNRVTAILNGERSVSASTALRLARFFATSPEFWLNLQAQYDLKVALKQEAAAIARIRPRRPKAA
jgi:antitoxin HigA-1